jgi:esterase/lipase
MSSKVFSKDETIALDIGDGKKLYVVFNKHVTFGCRGLIILSHGLTGRFREHIHVVAQKAFNAAGYDVARIKYYDGADDARSLVECTAKIHGADLATAVKHFRPQYDQLFVAGHSYGGFTMPHAFAIDGGETFNPNAVSFWDATFTPAWYKNAEHWPESDTFSYRNGQGPRMGRAMYDEAKFYNENPPVELYGAFTIPSQVVLALGNDKLGRGRMQVYESLTSCRKELVQIEGADHEFTFGDTDEQLIANTLRWFESNPLSLSR